MTYDFGFYLQWKINVSQCSLRKGMGPFFGNSLSDDCFVLIYAFKLFLIQQKILCCWESKAIYTNLCSQCSLLPELFMEHVSFID